MSMGVGMDVGMSVCMGMGMCMAVGMGMCVGMGVGAQGSPKGDLGGKKTHGQSPNK